MITEELLSEVLDEDITYYVVSNNEIFINKTDTISANYITVFGNFGIKINIHELAHKCKEWAYINGNLIMSGSLVFEGHKEGVAHIDGVQKWYADTEPEAIFKACQWILENKGNN